MHGSHTPDALRVSCLSSEKEPCLRVPSRVTFSECECTSGQLTPITTMLQGNQNPTSLLCSSFPQHTVVSYLLFRLLTVILDLYIIGHVCQSYRGSDSRPLCQRQTTQLSLALSSPRIGRICVSRLTAEPLARYVKRLLKNRRCSS